MWFLWRDKKTNPWWLVKFTIDSLHLLGETLMVRGSGTEYAEEWLWYFGSVFVTGSEYLSSSQKRTSRQKIKSMFCFFRVKGTAEFAGLDQRAVSNRGDARQGQSEFPLLICCLNENLHNKRLKFSSVKRPTRFRFGGKIFLIILKIILFFKYIFFLFIII